MGASKVVDCQNLSATAAEEFYHILYPEETKTCWKKNVCMLQSNAPVFSDDIMVETL